jgi:hypothetical protein
MAVVNKSRIRKMPTRGEEPHDFSTTTCQETNILLHLRYQGFFLVPVEKYGKNSLLDRAGQLCSAGEDRQ